MTTPGKTQVTEFRLEQLEALPAKIEEIRMTLIRLETAFNGGPGHWESCKQHQDLLEKMDKRVGGVERRMWAWSGGFAVLLLLVNILSPTVEKLLHIGKP